MILGKLLLLFNILASSLFASALPNWSLIENEEIGKKILPKNSEEINFFIQKAVDNFQTEVNDLVSTPSAKTTFYNTFERWNQIRCKIFSKVCLLQYVIMTTDRQEILNYSYEGIENLLNQFAETIERTELNRFLFENAKKAIEKPQNLNTYQSYIINDFINHCEEGLLEQDYFEVDQCKNIIQSLQKTPYLSLRGSQENSILNSNKQFTVLNFNVCFLPGKMVLPFGGVAQWKKRILPVINKIKDINADIVCLQEVFIDEAAKELHAGLEDSYSYFYMAIGPKQIGVNIKSLGLSSGLFIASKYELENPEFTIFESVEFPMNYGLFDFIVTQNKQPIAHLYTTHLQSLNLEGFSEIRANELKEIIKKMEKDSQIEQVTSPSRIPYFLCGDLNIPWGTSEPGEEIIQQHFYDNYNLNRNRVSESCRTCTEYFTNYLYKPKESIDSNAQILDYALLLDRFTNSSESYSKSFSLKTIVVPMNDYSQPLDALSDHHGLFSTISY